MLSQKRFKVRLDFARNGSQASFGLRHGFGCSVNGIQRLCFFVCFWFWIQFFCFGWLLCGCDSTLSWKHLKCWHGAYIPNWTKWDKMGALKRLETDNCCIRKDLAYCSKRTKSAAVWEFERNCSLIQFRDELKFSDTLQICYIIRRMQSVCCLSLSAGFSILQFLTITFFFVSVMKIF